MNLFVCVSAEKGYVTSGVAKLNFMIELNNNVSMCAEFISKMDQCSDGITNH